MTQPCIALLGLGIMGSGMAGRLLGAGFDLAVWNRNLAKADALAKQGARVGKTPGEAASGASIIISMLADDVASRAAWTGADGALASAKPGVALIECSTISPGWVRELATLAKEKGCTLIDAPVTGSKAAAAAGELSFLVGADAPIPDAVTKALQAMGKGITHLGPSGSGTMFKLINNFTCGVQLVAIAEALALLERTNIDRDKAIALLTNATPGSPMVKNVVPRMTAKNYTPNFLLKLMAKDMTYAIAEAKERSIDLKTAKSALEAMREAIPEHGEEDIASVVEWYRAAK